jgi:endonuclease/exonuclease/phosphatase family metal-dependent hydrolase
MEKEDIIGYDWEDEKKEQTHFHWSLLTWNILSSTSVVAKSKPDDPNYSTMSRKARICAILLKYNVDIIFLQEVDISSFSYDYPELFSMYHYFGHDIILKGKKQRTNKFGNVILFKKYIKLVQSIRSSRSIHCKLKLENHNDAISITFTNVHLPAKRGQDGYNEKRQHFLSCRKTWGDNMTTNCSQQDVVFGGDFNDFLSYKNSLGQSAGLLKDVETAGFYSQSKNDQEKKTCHMNNIDHVLTRGSLKTIVIRNTFYESMLQEELPNSIIPSDHIPILYILFDSRFIKKDGFTKKKYQFSNLETREYCQVDLCCEYVVYQELCLTHLIVRDNS